MRELTPYNPSKAMTHPPPPKAPHQMTDAELESPGLNAQLQDEKRHREIRAQIDSLIAAQADLKVAIARLEKPHWIIRWTLVVASLTLIVCVIGYWEQIKIFVRALKFW
jgi:hypothetical protein